METYYTEFSDLIAAWPDPVLLTDLGGGTFVTIMLHPGYIEAKWSGHLTADDVITASKVYLALLRNSDSPKLLNDKTGATGDWSEANDWLEFEWFPKAVKAGLRCVAHVYSNNMFSMLSARDLYTRSIPDLQTYNFQDRSAAEEWLLACKASGEAS
ncbi:hypothetical protein CLV24_101364 [Pontibacter ummariensis]|uniref:SpoIIAA-like n=1 Tax=Pontibacter ummariensis TaxID=1610492 RepID=A0A239BGK8_9BACT|nr:STAS/SEC14 domain-containing protein [Pontibacter ummariensis]PRY16518.1 hypothetical protein CLV24_101364 [Pontibacter ummariensis]SNS06581.1 hypothetical protein SAMN06296052_101364 [Pontibacter ummariensis]